MAGPTDATRTQRAKARPVLLRALRVAGSLPCPRCHEPMFIWQRLHVGHPQDVAEVGAVAASRMPLRLEHASCNQRAGDRRRRRRQPRGYTSSRAW